MIDHLHELEEPTSRERWIQRPGLAYLLPMGLSVRRPSQDALACGADSLECIGDARLTSAELLRAFRECGN